MSDRLSVLIVDDQAPFRLAMKAVLKRAAEFELVGRGRRAAPRRSTLAEELQPGAGPDGHQHARDERHRGDPAHRGRAIPTWWCSCARPTTSDDLPAGRGDQRRPGLRQQGAARRRHAAPALGRSGLAAASSPAEPPVTRPAGPSPGSWDPVPGSDSQRTVPPIAPSRSAMLTNPWPALRRRGIEPGPSSATVNSKPPDSSHRRDLDVRVRRVLGRVLQRLEAAEVDGRLDLGRVAADPLGHDLDRRAGCGCAAARSASASPLSTSSGG